MDSILPDIMLILGKYTPDKGVKLEQEAGSRTLDKAKKISSLCLAQLRRTPKGAVLAAGYEQDPQTYERPVSLELHAAIDTDPAFAASLRGLLVQYEHALEEYRK